MRVKSGGTARTFLREPSLSRAENSAAFTSAGENSVVGDLELLERPCNVDWWTSTSGIYKFYRGPDFPGNVVLKDRIGVEVKPGRPLDGFLLGRSATRIPSMYSHGLRLPLKFSILDGFDNPHTAQLLVQVDEHLCFKSRSQIGRAS